MAPDTTPAVTGRSLENTARAAVDHVATTGASALMVFDDVAVQVDPGDDVDTAIANHAAVERGILARLAARPLLAERAPVIGDPIETTTDDHYTRILAGSFGIITEVLRGDRGVERITVRFARRTVDYEPADFGTLRHAR